MSLQGDSNNSRGPRLFQLVRHVLFWDWDPIGVNFNAFVEDEYDAHVPRICRLLQEGINESELADELFQLETTQMAGSPPPRDRLLTVARKLLSLCGPPSRVDPSLVWDGEHDPEAVLTRLWERRLGSNRQYRLFSVACCRSVAAALWDEEDLLVLELVERNKSRAELDEFQKKYHARAMNKGGPAWPLVYLTRTDLLPITQAKGIARILLAAADPKSVQSPTAHPVLTTEQLRERLLNYLRDIFGLILVPSVRFDAVWKTPNITALAQTIYTDRAFDVMPILADALEEAGCTSDDILTHCRNGGEHVRGCWVVDLILGKE
jgi:hypothetical protein